MAKKLEETLKDESKVIKNTTSEAYLKELVPVKLIKDKQHKDDLFVRVNGHPYYIKRGELVLVPRFVAQVIDNKDRQEAEALERSESLQVNPNDPAFS